MVDEGKLLVFLSKLCSLINAGKFKQKQRSTTDVTGKNRNGRWRITEFVRVFSDERKRKLRKRDNSGKTKQTGREIREGKRNSSVSLRLFHTICRLRLLADHKSHY
jgi:hypothetical protein